ncbi:MAG TPA: sulfite exporter TauE/SafE family protein [Rubrobacteraceae bacterium]|nr:sulfite exporter TauE/SafE family protein [Rubrobacteraceae bacterium]
MESLFQIVVLAILGLFGGVLSGLAGVGGGVVFVPTLVYAAGWDIKEAVAASLVIVIFSSLSGTIRNARSEDPVEWRPALLLAASVAPASLIGVLVSTVSPTAVVQFVFAIILLVLAYPTGRGRASGPAATGKGMSRALVWLYGAAIGALSGLVGIGGGVVLVPLLMLGFGLSTKRAISTSLAVVFFTGIVASIGYIYAGFSDLVSLVPLVVGAMIGAWLGVRLRDRLPEKAIRLGFAGFMIVTALRTLSDALDIL